MTPPLAALEELRAQQVVADARQTFVSAHLAALADDASTASPSRANSLAAGLEQLAFSSDSSERQSYAEAAYLCRRAQQRGGSDTYSWLRHLAFLSADGLLARRYAELSLLLQNEDLAPEQELYESATWPVLLEEHLSRAFVLLCRKSNGWGDVREAVQQIARLRRVQEEFEGSWLNRANASTDDIGDVVALYNLARIVDIAGTYIVEGTPADPEVLIERHASQAMALVDSGSTTSSVELLIPAIRYGCLELVSSSIWHSTRRLGSKIREFVDRLAHSNRMDPILDLWPSQKEALSGSLLDPAKRAIVVEMPTSAGKTLVAEFAIVQSLALNPDSQVVYIVPTRALVNQVSSRLRRDLSQMGLQVEAAVPVFELDPTEDQFLKQDFDVLVTTPEKLDLLVRVDHPCVSKISLVVADEAHNIADGSRGARLELLLGTLRRERAEARFLLLTPFVPNGAELAMWLGDDPEGRIQVNWKPSERVAGALWWKKLRNGPHMQMLTSLPSHGNVDLPADTTLQLGAVAEQLADLGRSKARISTGIAADLSGVGGVLVLARGRATAEDRASDIAELMPEQRLEGLSEAVAHFARAELGSDHPLPSLLGRGVAFHHAGLSHDLRQLVELLIEGGDVRVVCGTTTLAQGVNFPIASVIVESQAKYVGPPKQWSQLTYSEFWNIAGRAGRALRDPIGLVLFPCRNRNDIADARTFLEAEAQNVSSVLLEAIAALGDAQEEFNLSFVARHEAVSIFLQYLTHALRVAGNDAVGGQIEDILRSSFVYAQARTGSQDVADRLVRLARTYLESQGGRNAGYLAMADGTGFSLSSVDFVMAAQREGSFDFSDPAMWEPPSLFGTETDHLTEIVDVLGRVPEIELGEAGFGSFDPARVAGMVRDWVTGKTIPQIADTWFSHIEDPRARLMRASTYVHSRLVGLVPWGLGVVQRVSLPESAAEQVGHVPSLVHYGVSSKEAVGLRMGGVPRIAAEGLAANWRGSALTATTFADIRNWIASLSSAEWAASLPAETPLTGPDCKRIWDALTGLDLPPAAGHLG
ncbi:MAG: DEAD/DEAH box helicase [Roseovarius sp.]|jgi:hypothetical protein|nr:DEAD/DEAH box helicase [Roseovarius sp.]